MSESTGRPTRRSRRRTLHRAPRARDGFFSITADMYGPFKNEILVGKAIRDRREPGDLATKFGNRARRDNKIPRAQRKARIPRGRARRPLKRLGVDPQSISLPPPQGQERPIRGPTVGAMADLVRQGKVRHIGPVGGVGANDPARAQGAPDHGGAVEYSLWTARPPKARCSTRCARSGSGWSPTPARRGFPPARPSRRGDARARVLPALFRPASPATTCARTSPSSRASAPSRPKKAVVPRSWRWQGLHARRRPWAHPGATERGRTSRTTPRPLRSVAAGQRVSTIESLGDP